MSDIAVKLNDVQVAIDDAMLTAGNDRCELIAVSKTVGINEIQAAYDAGQRRFGENRIPPLVEKVPALPDDIIWHFIGHLQSNKVKQVVPLMDWIDSVDSVKLMQKIDQAAGELGKEINFLIQVNVSGEESKSGFEPEEMSEVVRQAMKCKHAKCRGLMTMAPYVGEEEELRQIFQNLYQLRDKLQQELNVELTELSMGMSNDYPIAISEGSTMVRVGSAIFK